MTRPKRPRRLTFALGLVALIGAAVTLLIVPPSPALAAGGGCEILSGWNAQAGSHIFAARYRFCGETETPLPVRIEQYQSPGVWLTVASGTGEVTYNCNGSAFNRYRIPLVTGEFDILCG